MIRAQGRFLCHHLEKESEGEEIVVEQKQGQEEQVREGETMMYAHNDTFM